MAAVASLLVCLAVFTVQADEPSAVDYATMVKPILRGRCYACHGALKQEGELRLDTRASMVAGGATGAAITPGDAANSLLIARVSERDPARRMPPEHEGEALSASQIETLRRWIVGGAAGVPDEKPADDPRNHWAFQTIERPAVPVVGESWNRNAIDAFIAAKHAEHQFSPAPEADRITLFRRLSIDLIGLPPTPEEIAAVQQDPTDAWYERAVERLLDDPRHGERWARHWMDIWRYSDWWGLGDQLRNSQKHIWHWRDWLIESLNHDAPYDEMIRLMLAADELHPNDLSKLRATGFLARNYFLFNRNQWMEETVEHVGKGFLGLTMNCAKCHDHKYDPFAQTDFYRLRAFFEPYHVRNDLPPGETDLSQNGIPRAFDGLLDSPTYRFVRGQESNPDKSAVIAPGVPRILEFAPLAIEPVTLPRESWLPDLRPWVVEAWKKRAAEKQQSEEAKRNAMRERLAAAAEGEPKRQAEEDLAVAELAYAAAQAEAASIEQRAAATAALALADSDPAATEQRENTNRAAVVAEREFAVALAKWKVAQAELQAKRAADDKREAANKELATAKESLDQATKKLTEPPRTFTRFTGGEWMATRFFNSGKDDPTVTFPSTSSGRRTALAGWLTDRRNPLTARVAVNHLWARHTGAPLVPTVFDFGNNGARPVHRELLDWLAVELMENGWSMKHIHRLIVQSATYRMASRFPASQQEVETAQSKLDPDQRFLWRRAPQRIESQVVRDSILSLAGQLDETQGGPPVPMASQEASRRRSLYFFHSNNERNLFLTTFDEALVKECYRREQSIVPQQALALTHSKLVLDAARPIAERLSKVPDQDDAAFVRQAFAVILGVEPSTAEAKSSLDALAAWRKMPEAAADPHFAPSQLVWVLLNHTDFVTLR